MSIQVEPRKFLAALFAILGLAAVASLSSAQTYDIGWPRELDTDSAKIVVYQPQPESLNGIALAARSAVAVTLTGKTPVFGVVWFSSRAQTDKDTRVVSIDQVVVSNVRFPGSTPEQETKFRNVVNPLITKWTFTIALDRFQASLADAAAQQRSADSLNTDAPVVLFSNVPAALLLYAGDPILQGMRGTGFERAVNTPMFVVRDTVNNTFYLNGGPLWYSASAALGPWTSITTPPPAVKALVPDSLQRDSAPPSGPPKIIVATKPTELIVFQGEPKWSPVTGVDLLYVTNTDRNVFKLLADQQTYVLLSGRWFRASSFSGPWTFVRPDSLPAVFAKIPPASLQADVLASVPGTEQANDALLDAQIPQTAAINRATAKLTVQYDGDPKFEAIPGTSVSYATNTQTQVLKIDGIYYACDNAVWFSLIGPIGPWTVSDSVPKAVQTIPPSSPVYNTKYVEVYQSTPQVVYVGYTPGYVGMYPYYGTIVYGTGWYYPPYVSPYVYYPRPVTYGVAVRYNPWTGFTVGFGYSTPFMHVGIVVGGPRYGGWYGPYGRPPYPPPYYRPPYGGYPGYRPGYGGGYPGYGARPGYGAAGGARPGTGGARPTPYGGNNMYRQPGNTGRVTQPTAGTMPSGKPASGRPNNVVAGKDGNVYRQNGNQVQQNKGGQWQNSGTRNNDVNRTQQNRQHGQQRTQSYNNARSGASTRSAPRSGGGGRGRP